MPNILIIKRYTLCMVKSNPDVYFVFSDNLIQQGYGGQAIIRDEPNTIGVPTKKYPNNTSCSFFTDDDYEENKKHINKAFKEIKQKLKDGFHIALPQDGLGTGLADLSRKAPKTFEYLQKKINDLKKKNKVYLIVDSSK